MTTEKTVSQQLFDHRRWLFELEAMALKLGHRQLSEEIREQYRTVLGIQDAAERLETHDGSAIVTLEQEREYIKTLTARLEKAQAELETERSHRNYERSITSI